MTTATYTKLNDGAWGVRALGAVKAGAAVTVTTKAGAVKSERVARVLWSGADKRTGAIVSLCAIEQRAQRAGWARAYRDTDTCSCAMCSSGSECLCLYGRG